MAAPSSAIITLKFTDYNSSRDFFVDHKNFSELTMKRTANDTCNEFTLNILDDSAYTIESILLSGYNNIEFSYMDTSSKNEYTHVTKTFAGSVIKMSSSMIDNRFMLTLTGYVGLQVGVKYDNYTVLWNKVPKFDWSKIFSDSAVYTSIDANSDDDSSWSKFWQSVSSIGSMSISGWKMILASLGSDKKIGDMESAETNLEKLFTENRITCAVDGTYFIDSMKYGEDDDEHKEITAEEYFLIPMKPHKIIEFIGKGGDFTDLLEDEYTDYVGTSFYEDDISEFDWKFIKRWFKEMGHWNGLNWSFGTIEETEYVEDDLSQSKTPFLTYIKETLINRSYKKDKDKTYANFYLSFDQDANGNTVVNFKRLDASKAASATPKAQYQLYGKANAYGSGQGVLTSLTASQDILSSMIAASSYDGSGDISTINIVTGESTTVTTSSNQVTYDHLSTPDWGVVKVSSVGTSGTSSNSSTVNKATIFSKAEALCYKAEATVSGYNTLGILDYIDIFVLSSDGSNNTPKRHHTSGRYMIISIEDSLSNGKFSSKLTLIKNVNSLGSTAFVTGASDYLESKEKESSE